MSTYPLSRTHPQEHVFEHKRKLNLRKNSRKSNPEIGDPFWGRRVEVGGARGGGWIDLEWERKQNTNENIHNDKNQNIITVGKILFFCIHNIVICRIIK